MPLTMLIAGLLLGVGAILVTGVYHRYKPLPGAIARRSRWFPGEDSNFLIDHRYADAGGRGRSQRELIPAMLRMIAEAQSQLILDVFLFSGDGAHQPDQVPVARTLTRALIERKHQKPSLRITVIVDPINSYYGAHWPEHFSQLEKAGIEVIETPLARLRDSNPLWSAPWRLLAQPFGNHPETGWLPNPIGPHRVTLRSWLALFNFRANHRKVLVGDSSTGWRALVSSGNPHDASSTHTNVGLRLEGEAALALMQQEEALVAFCRDEPLPPTRQAGVALPSDDTPSVRLLTESSIRDATLELIDGAQAGDALDLAQFYLSHRGVIRSLKAAHRRECRIRVLLDPNKDAFGRIKGGLPNRQVAWELHRQGIEVRWYRTHGEQFHCKYLRLERQDGNSDLILGSANFTRRNLDDLNLEAACQFHGREHDAPLHRAGDWFERCWHNPPGFQCSVPYSIWADERLWRYGLYRITEFTGCCSY